MKVLILNGSPRKGGNTTIALDEMVQIFEAEGIETEVIRVGNKAIRGCIACNSCAENGQCVFDDIVNEIAPKFEEADGLVVASPVYYASANATLVACQKRRMFRDLRRAQQVFHDQRHAGRFQPVLEQRPRPHEGRSRP